jgi:hypothetical protein
MDDLSKLTPEELDDACEIALDVSQIVNSAAQIEWRMKAKAERLRQLRAYWAMKANATGIVAFHNGCQPNSYGVGRKEAAEDILAAGEEAHG